MASIGGVFESPSTVQWKIIDGVSRQYPGVAAGLMFSFSIPVYQMTIQLHAPAKTKAKSMQSTTYVLIRIGIIPLVFWIGVNYRLNMLLHLFR